MKEKKSILSLNGPWQLRWSDGERGDRLPRMLEGKADWSRAWEAEVPGSVHETLIRHGVIPEPAFGTNVLACRWVEEMVWSYRRTFDAPKPGKGERAWLVFETLDLAAKIILNGKLVATHANAFYPCRVEVTQLLRPGSNELIVEVESGIYHAMERSAEGLVDPLNFRLTKLPWLRKTQSQHGWDWAPRLLNVGIPDDVRLEFATGVRWDGCSICSETSDDLREGRLTVRVFSENLGDKPVSAEIVVAVDGTGQAHTQRVTLAPGENRSTVEIRISDPALWWPVGHGSQHRYPVAVQLKAAGRLIGSDTKKAAFRRARINQDSHPGGGRSFIVEINGKPIFCKGGNYVPVDLILSRVDRARHAELIDRAIEAHANFLRIWGGGVYESDDFYDLCDERGILVWQDMVFACHRYPATDEDFLADVTREIRHQVRRLAHHPSLVVWCGNNEMEWGAWEWGRDKGVAHPDYALFHLVIPRLLRDEDPARYYQPSSPYSPDCAAPNADHLGDQHPWSIGFGDSDFRKYREMTCRFPNEGGILGPPGLASLRATLAGGPEKIGSFAWEIHENSIACNPGLVPYAPDVMVQQWLGRSVAEMSLEDYAFWGGLLQGAGLAEYIKNFRRRMFDSAAAIFWMYNDIWPCSRSWTIVDWQARRTPAFWPVRRAFAPVTLVVTREGETVRVHGINEGPQISATLRYGLLSLGGTYPSDETLPVTLPANASTVLAEFPAARWDRLGIRSHVAFAVLADGPRELARDCLILPLFREMKWPEAQVRVTLRDGKAVFTSDTFVWRVCLDLDGERPLPDNFFDIFPGVPTVLAWPKSLGRPKVLRIGNPVKSK